MRDLSSLGHLFVCVFLYNFSSFMVIPAITDVTMAALCPGRDECSLAIYLSGFQQAVSLSLALSLSVHLFLCVCLQCSLHVRKRKIYRIHAKMNAEVSIGRRCSWGFSRISFIHLSHSYRSRRWELSFSLLSSATFPIDTAGRRCSQSRCPLPSFPSVSLSLSLKHRSVRRMAGVF